MAKCRVEVLKSFSVSTRYVRVGAEIEMDRKQAKAYEGLGRVKIMKAKRPSDRPKTQNRAILETEEA